MKNKTILISFMAIFLIIMTGCFQGEQSLQDIDSPQDQDSVTNSSDESDDDNNKGDNTESENDGETVIETVPRQLYLMDVNGMIAEQTLELPQIESKEVATQVLSYLIKDGPVSSILPNGFQAVLPEGTEILGLNIQEDGTLIVDLSEEFKEYEADDELGILQAMTYTLTQFESVDKIQLRINGYPQEEMPVNGTPIGDGYSRVNGINLVDTDVLDLINSQAVTMYYPTEYNDNRYYVPVTKHLDINDEDIGIIASIVDSLIEGPGYDVNLTQVFNLNTSLLEKPTLEDGVLKLVFNEEILKDIDQAMISDEVMETLVRTLTEQNSIDAVEVMVDNIETLVNENGESYDEPVTNHTFVSQDKL